jgi:ribosome modulation factor
MTLQPEKYFKEGSLAFKSGKKIQESPYKANPDKTIRENWRNGWKQAKEYSGTTECLETIISTTSSTWSTIQCPFCLKKYAVKTRQFGGSGKRCDCGTKINWKYTYRRL